MKVILMMLGLRDEGYSYDAGLTWWRLFLWCWAYLMKVILMMLGLLDEGYSRHASCALNYISTCCFFYIKGIQAVRIEFFLY